MVMNILKDSNTHVSNTQIYNFLNLNKKNNDDFLISNKNMYLLVLKNIKLLKRRVWGFW